MATEEPNNWPECKAELVKCIDEERGVCLVTSHVIGSVVPFHRFIVHHHQAENGGSLGVSFFEELLYSS